MDDLISREGIKRLTTKRNNIWNEITDAEGRGLDEILNSLRSIDAVPVVRCKDCKYWNPHIKECEGIVNWFGLANEWSENGFCFKGERKEE